MLKSHPGIQGGSRFLGTLPLAARVTLRRFWTLPRHAKVAFCGETLGHAPSAAAFLVFLLLRKKRVAHALGFPVLAAMPRSWP